MNTTEQSSLYFEDHILIWVPDTNEILIHKRG